MNGFAPLRAIGGQLRFGRRLVRSRMIAIDDVMFFGERDPRRIGDLMPHHDEDERSRASLFQANVGDARYTLDVIANPKRVVKIQTPAGPHAPGKIDGWKKASALRMPVRSEFGLLVNGKEVEPVPQGRKPIAGAIGVQGCGQSGNRRGRNHIGEFFGSADPRLQMFDVQSPE